MQLSIADVQQKHERQEKALLTIGSFVCVSNHFGILLIRCVCVLVSECFLGEKEIID